MRIIDGKDEYKLDAIEARKVRELLATFKEEKSDSYYDRILDQIDRDKRRSHQPTQQKEPQKLPQDFRGIVHV